MRAPLLRDMDGWASVAAPGVLLLALALLSALPTPLFETPLPDVLLASVYVVCARRPGAVSAGVLFGLGLLRDLLGATPVGLHAALFVLIHATVRGGRQRDRSILRLWLGFMPVAAAAGGISWAVVSAYHLVWISPEPIAVQAAVSALAFPLIAAPLLALLGAGDP